MWHFEQWVWTRLPFLSIERWTLESRLFTRMDAISFPTPHGGLGHFKNFSRDLRAACIWGTWYIDQPTFVRTIHRSLFVRGYIWHKSIEGGWRPISRCGAFLISFGINAPLPILWWQNNPIDNKISLPCRRRHWHRTIKLNKPKIV